MVMDAVNKTSKQYCSRMEIQTIPVIPGKNREVNEGNAFPYNKVTVKGDYHSIKISPLTLTSLEFRIYTGSHGVTSLLPDQ